MSFNENSNQDLYLNNQETNLIHQNSSIDTKPRIQPENNSSTQSRSRKKKMNLQQTLQQYYKHLYDVHSGRARHYYWSWTHSTIQYENYGQLYKLNLILSLHYLQLFKSYQGQCRSKARQRLVKIPNPTYDDAVMMLRPDDLYDDTYIVVKPCSFDSNPFIKYCFTDTNSVAFLPLITTSFSDTVGKRKKNELFAIIKQQLKKDEKETCEIKKSSLKAAMSASLDTSHPIKPTQRIINAEFRYSPKKIADYLYHLTDGDFDTLQSIAKLVAIILRKPYTPHQPITITAKKSSFESIISFLNFLCPASNYGFTYLTNKHYLFDLYTLVNNEFGLNIILDSRIPEGITTIKKLKSIFTLKDVEIDLPFMFEPFNIKLNIPHVYLTSSHINTIKMKNLFNSIIIDISAKNLMFPKFTPNVHSKVMDWMYHSFSIWGLELLLKNKPHNFDNINPLGNASKPKNKKTKDEKKPDVFEEFFNAVCEMDKDYEIPKEELYQAYVVFYKKFYGDEPLKKITFSKRFLEFKPTLEETRPHISRDYYPRCFKGIKVNYEKLQVLKNSSSESLDNTQTNNQFSETKVSFSEFKKYLNDETHKAIKSHFYFVLDKSEYNQKF